MNSRNKLSLFIIIIFSLIFRIGAALYMGDEVVNLPGTTDQISYHTLALRVLNGHGFTFGEAWWPATVAGAPTAHWSYLYTIYLVIIYTLFGPHPLAARLIQVIIVSALQPILTYLIANRVFKNRAPLIGLVAAGITAIYTYFIYYAGALMTESFFILAVLASLFLAIHLVDLINRSNELKSNSLDTTVILTIVTLGMSLGAAIFLRQVILLFVPFLFAWIWLSSQKYHFTALLLSGSVILILIIPFTIFNYVRFGHFVLLNTNAGFAFFWANHPIYGTHFQPILKTSSYYELIPPELLSLDEAALDQALLKRGVQFILNDPLRYILLSISRIPAFFMFWPSIDSGLISNISRVMGFGILWPFMLYGLILSFVSRSNPFINLLSSPLMLLYSFVIIYTMIHLLSWALIRYRLPVDAILIDFAGLAMIDLAQRITFRYQRTQTPKPNQQGLNQL
jgi:hypothetical protein